MSTSHSFKQSFGLRSAAWCRAVMLPALIALLLTAVLGAPGLALADFSYTVKSGDTLSKIAKNNGTTIDALVAANKGQYPCLAKNPSCLQIGWVITIPGGGGSSGPVSGPSTYTVVSGDSLAKIAKKLGVDFNALIAANKQDRPCLAAAKPCALQVGWVLNVPGGAAVQAGDPKAAVVEYIAAFNAYDVNRWKATLHPDVLKNITAKNEEDLKDAFAIASFLEIKYEIVDLQVLQQTNDTAVVAYTIKGSSGLDPNTPPETFTGKFLLMKYQGQWKIYFQSFTDAETIK